MRFLIRKAIQDAQWLWIASALGVFAFCWLRIWLVAQLEMSNFQQIVVSLGDEFEKFSPVPLEQLFTYLGRIARSYSEPIVTVCITAWAVARGSDVVSGGISRGALEMVLAQPVSRRQIVLSQLWVMTAGTLALSLIAWLGIWVGIQTNETTETVRAPIMSFPGLTIPNPFGEPREVTTPMREHVRAADLLPGSVALFAYGFFVAGFATWMSSWDRFRWRTIGLTIGFLIFQSTLLYFGISSESLGALKWFTVLSAYNPERNIAAVSDNSSAWLEWVEYDPQGEALGLGCLGSNFVLLTLGAACYALAMRTFVRRDLPAPH